MKKECIEESITQLNEDILNCFQCDIAYRCKQKVFGEGNNTVKIMSISEAPGKDEDFIGRVYQGKAGKLWEELLFLIDLKRNDIYATNALHCKPINNIINKDMHEVKNCQSFLLREVKLVKPKVIILWGKTAVNSLLNFKYEKLSMKQLVMGCPYDYDGIPVFINYHPSFLMRNNPDTNYWLVVDTLYKLKAHYEKISGL